MPPVDPMITRDRVIELRRRGWTVPGIVAQTGAETAWVQAVCDFVDNKRADIGRRRAVFSTVDRARAGRG